MNDKSTTTGTGGEFLSFALGEEHYGVDILKVQEIRGYDSVLPSSRRTGLHQGCD